MKTLIFDGDCAFCQIWVNNWKTRTGDTVRYLPIKAALSKFPQLAHADLKQRVHLVVSNESGAQVYSGAEAVFRALASNPLIWLYLHFPGFAFLTEFLYGLVARHRNAAMKVTQALWGDSVEPSEYSHAALVFTRVLSFIYLLAFASIGTQVRGLIGEEGILPITTFLANIQKQIGVAGFWRLPTLFWLDSSDLALLTVCWGGVALSAISIIAKPFSNWQRTVFAILWLYYLSLVAAGQMFMGFQWDFLLLETGFLAIFLKPARGRVWLFHLLLFRLMFESGAVKLLSHDPSWANLTALDVHFQTQPLPNLVVWFVHQLPSVLHKAATGTMFVIELPVPFLILGPRRVKQFAGLAFILLQTLIFLTGNYTFFNILTAALCLLLFDDTFFRSCYQRLKRKLKPVKPVPVSHPTTRVVSAAIVSLSVISLLGVFAPLPKELASLETWASSIGIVNRYGLFAVMTVNRPEIQIEGSLDGEHWLEYKFRHKPGPLDRAPSWVAPFQPRLDWQMWFAAVSGARQTPWLVPLVLRTLEASKPVLALYESRPFGPNPPKYVRALLYDYKFTTFTERRQTGNYWKRELKGVYFPPVGLRGQPPTTMQKP